MAVLFTEGFDHYNAAADLTKRWSFKSSGPTYAFTAGRFGGQAVRISINAGTERLIKPLGSNISTIIAGFAYRTNNYTTARMICFRDGTTLQTGFTLDASGHIQAYRNTTANILGTGTTVLSTGTFYYIEVKIVFSGSVGTIQVYINDTLELNLSGLNNIQSANAYANQFCLDNGAGQSDFDDIYVSDTSGAFPQNDRLGPCQIQWLSPDGDTAQKDLTPDTGVTNYSRVNETLLDTTNYVSGSAAGKDLYTVGDLAVVPFVYAVKIVGVAASTTPGLRVVRGIMKNGATTTNGTSVGVNGAAECIDNLYNQNPNTSAQWTAADVNAMQVGAEIVS